MENNKINFTDKFLEAYKNLIKNEGGYNYYEFDKGKETYKGISRKFHPEWEGWKIIDKYKEDPYFKEGLSYCRTTEEMRELFKELDEKLFKDEKLEYLTKKFYWDNYWQKLKLDELDFLIASKLLDLSVNTGNYIQGGKYFQTALNYLNKNETLYPDLKIDGIIGPKTLNAYKLLEKEHVIDILLSVIKSIQGRHYLDLMDEDPENERFRGWFRRI